MAFVKVKTNTGTTEIEVPDTSIEAAGMIYPQFESISDFIIIQNHVFSKMAIDHLHIEAHPDEQEQIEKAKEADGNGTDEKETNYML